MKKLQLKQNVRKKNSRARGFTLLEVLVVLVIVSLISTLLLQGFGYTLNLRTRVLKQLGRVQNEELIETWFRRTTSSFILREKLQEEPLYFNGSSKEINGDSLFSLEHPPGVLSTIQWRVENGNDGYVRLYYNSLTLSALSETAEVKNGWLIAEWFAKDANFSFRDKDGNWHARWPPQQYKDELPIGIMLNVENEEQPYFWYSRILGEKKAPIIYRP